MKRPYELTYVLRIDPSEDVMNQSMNEIKDWIETDDLGQVTKIDRWGRRKLAYEIDKQREGFYVHIHADIETSSIEELERNLQLAPHVLRYLLIRRDE